MKALFWIVVIAVIGILFYLWVNSTKQKVDFEFDFGGISFADLKEGDKPAVQLDLLSTIKNGNNFALSFSDVHIQLFYRSTIIATSADKEKNFRKIVVPAKGQTQVTQSFNLYPNSSMFYMFADLVKNKKADIEYIVKFKTLGWNFEIKGFYTYRPKPVTL